MRHTYSTRTAMRYWLLMVPSIPVAGIALDLHPTVGNALTLVLLPLVVGYLLHRMEVLHDYL